MSQAKIYIYLIHYVPQEVSATEAQGWLSTDWLSTANIEQLNKVVFEYLQFSTGIHNDLHCPSHQEQEALFTLENKPFWRDASDPIQNATDVEK